MKSYLDRWLHDLTNEISWGREFAFVFVFSGVFKKVGVIKGSVGCSARYLFTGLSQFGYLIFIFIFFLYINVTFIQKELIPM